MEGKQVCDYCEKTCEVLDPGHTWRKYSRELNGVKKGSWILCSDECMDKLASELSLKEMEECS